MPRKSPCCGARMIKCRDFTRGGKKGKVIWQCTICHRAYDGNTMLH